MFADAHLHLVDLEARDPGFAPRFAAGPYLACAASHDEAEFHRTLELASAIESLRAAERAGRPADAGQAPALVPNGRVPEGQVREGPAPEGPAPTAFPSLPLSFGIHPQWAVWNHADFLASLAATGRIAAIGEAGFDFFGDRPERVRNPENEGIQSAVFEFQLALAERHGLPMVLHVRKAMDRVFAASRRLARLPAVILHSYQGTAREGADLLARGVAAYFSFGAAILNGHKRAIEACATLPADRLLSETDAPWQPPRGREFCGFEAVADVVKGMAALRGTDPSALERVLEANFRRAYAPATSAPPVPDRMPLR